MSFDLAKFQGTPLTPRQATLPVPDLRAFFAPDADPVFVVRGLTGEEIARAHDVTGRQARLAAHIAALSAAGGGDVSETGEALKSLLGYGEEVTEDLARRIDHLVSGCVTPALDRAAAVKLFAAYPMVAYQVSNKILELTGLGPDLGKAPPSTPAPTS